ncbi:MAG: hypothetical protein CMO01_21850 [Thalassobius sp.]|nr:hypothetical protein [Thalassovita sp.]
MITIKYIRNIAILLILYLSQIAFGQGSQSFHSAFKNEVLNDDLLQITVVAENFLQKNNPDSALFFATQAIEKEQGEVPSEMRTRNLLTTARAYEMKGQRGSSLKYYLRSVKEIEGLSDEERLADVYVEIGHLYRDWDSSSKALEYLMFADERYRLNGNIEARLVILEEISNIYEDEGNYEKLIDNGFLLASLYDTLGDWENQIKVLKRNTDAYRKLKFYEEALQNHISILNIGKNAENAIEIGYALNEIGYIYKDLENYNKSLGYFLQFLILCKELKMDNHHFEKYSEALLTVGEIYQQLGDKGEEANYNHALNSYDKKLQVSLKANDDEGIARTYNQMSLIYRKLKESNAAIKYGKLALDLALELQNKSVLLDSYNNLYLAYQQRNRDKQTIYYYKLYSNVKESILNDKLDRQKELLEREAAENRKQFIINKTEQMIVGEELDTLNVRKLQLEAEKKTKDLELLLIDKELKETELKNEQLKREKALQELMLVQNQFEDERKAKEITLLRKDAEIKAYALKQKELEEIDRLQDIAMLEKDQVLKELEISKQETINKYSIAGITLITIILCLILYTYFQTRKANKKLAYQKSHIQNQAQTLEKAYKNLELLSKIGQDITASLTVKRITETAYSKVNKLMDASVFGIGIYNNECSSLEFPIILEDGLELENVIFQRDEVCLANLCFNESRELLVSNFQEEYAKFLPGELPPPKAGKRNAKSIIYIPLKIKEICVGVLTVQCFSVDAYSAYHINILRNMAIYIQIALENSNAYRQIADKSKTLRIANENIKHQKDLIEEKNKELLSLNNEKNHLIGIVAHDLRNPLAIAISLTEFIKQDKSNLTTEQLEGLNITNRSLERMNDMIRRILDVKAVEAKTVNLNLEKVDVSQVINQIIDNFTEQLEKKDIQLEFELHSESPFAKLDYSYSIQVFENLISNAIKFSPKGKKVKVVVNDAKENLQIKVSDQGPGILEEDFPKLFGKYQRLSARPTAGEMSTGLGLSIVKKYVEVMEGKVWCESEVGKGADFIVEFKRIQLLVA